MHGVSHCLPHRGPNATRPRARWQPYSSSITLSSALSTSRTPPVSYLHTPAASVTSSPPTAHVNPSCDHDFTNIPPLPLPQLPRVGSSRDTQKARYVTRLIDQAVRSLCDIWQPDDIPPAFSVPPLPFSFDTVRTQSEGRPCTINPGPFTGRNTQLPSPVSPSTQPSPLPAPPDPCGRSVDPARVGHVVPIKGFVHEVLRRSRTSTGVLQTALCYLEAVRSKVPELLRQEKSKANLESSGDGTDVHSRISRVPIEEIEEDPVLQGQEEAATDMDISDTVRVADILEVPSVSFSTIDGIASSHYPPTFPSQQRCSALPPLPPLPSPLLCPRRTFLACLILASKFMQDRSYSNRAWAKLAGLPPREIGRCERALGDALDWRLWVGKNVNVASTNNSGGRTVARSKSEGELLNKPYVPLAPPWSIPAANLRCLDRRGAHVFADTYTAMPTPLQTPQGLQHTALRRSATVPFLPTESSTSTIGNHEVFSAPAYVDEPEEISEARIPANAGSQNDLMGRSTLSPFLSTPTLSYSPMSTSSTSSDGMDDRTIHVTVMELPTPSPASYSSAPFLDDWRRGSDTGLDFVSGSKAIWAPPVRVISDRAISPAAMPCLAGEGYPSLSFLFNGL